MQASRRQNAQDSSPRYAFTITPNLLYTCTMNQQEPKLSPEEWRLNQERKRLVYKQYARHQGHDVSRSEIEELRRSIQEITDEITGEEKNVELSRRQVADLQERLALVRALEDEDSEENLKLLVYQMDHVKVRMRPEDKHQRAHFHIEFKGEYSASYAVDTLEKLAGEMPRKYEEPILEWASDNKESLKMTWDKLSSGEDVRELIRIEDTV